MKNIFKQSIKPKKEIQKIINKISPGLNELLLVRGVWKKTIEPTYKKSEVKNLKNQELFVSVKKSHPIIKKTLNKNKKSIIEKLSNQKIKINKITLQ